MKIHVPHIRGDMLTACVFRLTTQTLSTPTSAYFRNSPEARIPSHRTPFRLVSSVRTRTSFTLVYTSRQLRPSALFSSCPQKPETQNAPHVFASLFRAQWLEPSLTASLSPHASQSFGIGCSFGFGRSMPSASSSLASFSISYACTYFVHNLYTKTNTATNHVSNLHPCCLYAGTQNTAKKLRRVNSPSHAVPSSQACGLLPT